MATMHKNVCGNCVDRISLTVHSHAILKTVKSMCNDIKKSNARTVGGQIKLGHLKFNLRKSDH
jgi:hypothetical protein